MKITRIRFYHNPSSRPIFNQSYHVVTVETDAGITGIGEGGAAETVQQCAAMIVGEDPSRMIDFIGLGPEAPNDTAAERRFFGED